VRPPPEGSCPGQGSFPEGAGKTSDLDHSSTRVSSQRPAWYATCGGRDGLALTLAVTPRAVLLCAPCRAGLRGIDQPVDPDL
jgi:hypothetical protein